MKPMDAVKRHGERDEAFEAASASRLVLSHGLLVPDSNRFTAYCQASPLKENHPLPLGLTSN